MLIDNDAVPIVKPVQDDGLDRRFLARFPYRLTADRLDDGEKCRAIRAVVVRPRPSLPAASSL